MGCWSFCYRTEIRSPAFESAGVPQEQDCGGPLRGGLLERAGLAVFKISKSVPGWALVEDRTWARRRHCQEEFPGFKDGGGAGSRKEIGASQRGQRS